MGFNNSASTITLTAKLTPFGRQQILGSATDLITHFALGDSDANYYASLPLNSGEVPNMSGNKASNSNANNNLAPNFNPRSTLVADTIGNRKKLVGNNSSTIVSSTTLLGETIISGSNLTQVVIDRTDTTTDSLVNLFYSFNLPINSADKLIFTGTTSANGGYSDTALSGISQNKILVIAVNQSQYGEMLDGKAIKVELTTTASTTYTLYSTFEKTLTKATVQDATYRETSFSSAIFGNNVAFMFSDDIQKPNNDSSKSWGTGFNKTKPFSVNRKETYNLLSSIVTSTTADKSVGISHLDKGFIIITEPSIVNNFDPQNPICTGTVVTTNSISSEVSQVITCIADRGEFGSSNNPTFSTGDTPRISEVLLLDIQGNIIAVAKLDRHIERSAQKIMALGVKISI